jgi:TctA family transporter
MVLGLIGAVVIANRSVLRAIGMVLVGLILGLVGIDVNSGASRFTFGLTQLLDGIGFIGLAVGVFAVTEIVMNLEKKDTREVFTDKVGKLMPSRDEFRQSAKPIARGTLIGSMLGILPAGGALLASFASYAVEKRLAKDPSRFGKGAIEGVAGPESANNAGAQTSFIPMLTLGIPPNVVMALMIGAMMLHNIQPGPQVMTKNPELFWGLIASMWLGNLMLVVLNLPLIGIWVRLLSVPYRLLYPAIILFCCIGVYTLSNNTFDVRLVVLFGAVGYLFAKIGCEPAPMLLGFVLGPMMEEYFRRALLIERGDFRVFIERPISAGLLAAALALLVSMSLPAIAKWRQRAVAEQGKA